ncbi:transporter [Xanthobacter sp. KR7-65]|uniref:SphA family protein n=1 Tax=Xanthobacter sp. KR7-65 TaxID=3156612 RepID=UPI0032B5D157
MRKGSLQKAAVFGLAALGGFCGAAQGAENGVGFYMLGGRGPMAGYVPPPGFYLQSDTFYYNGSLGASKELPSGGNILGQVSADIVAELVTATWVLPEQVLGGSLAVGLILPVGQPQVTAGVLLNPAGVDPVGRRVSDSAFIMGDPVASMALGWHSGNWHWNVAALLNIPVGDYREGEIANLAFHRLATDLSTAVTWLDPTSGWEISAAAGITFNGTNDVTEYTTGTEFHLEWAVTKSLTKQFTVGLVGYFYDQITGDSGPGARLGAFEGRVTALGGMVAYNFELAGTPISTRVRVYREFDVVNRLEGVAGFGTVAFPIALTK